MADGTNMYCPWPQDGGAGKLGTLTSLNENDGWVDVTWDAGHSNTYRIGRDGGQGCDLKVGRAVGEGEGGPACIKDSACIGSMN